MKAEVTEDVKSTVEGKIPRTRRVREQKAVAQSPKETFHPKGTFSKKSLKMGG